MYQLKNIRTFVNMCDFEIVYLEQSIGLVSINLFEDKIFIRQIRIDGIHKRKGHARNVIKLLFKTFNKNIRFCIATNSKSAILFWDQILKENTHKYIRGDIYEIIYERNDNK